MAKHELDPIQPSDEDVFTAHAEIPAHQKALTATAGDEVPAGAYITGLGVHRDGRFATTYKPSGNLFTAANQPSALDVHFTTEHATGGLTAEQSDHALDVLIASVSARLGRPGDGFSWAGLVQNMPHDPPAEVMAITATVGKPMPAFDNRLEITKISDAAHDLVERARRAGLVLTIETTRFDDPLVMGNYQLQVELRPSLASIRERDARRALADLEFERAEAARQLHI